MKTENVINEKFFSGSCLAASSTPLWNEERSRAVIALAIIS